MKNIYLSLVIFFIFTACQNKQENIKTNDLSHHLNNFSYQKNQIQKLENSFKDIVKSKNIILLKEYKKFYKENTSYFINGKNKVKYLNKAIKKLENKKNLRKKLNKDKSITSYKELAKQGNIKAQRYLVDFYKYSNTKESLKWLEILVKNNDIKSMKDYASANIYMIKPVQKQDIKKAVKVYEKLAILGELSSIMNLANIYEYSYHKKYIKQDKQKALKYYEEASNKNYINAQKKLLKIYLCKQCKPNRYDLKKANSLKKVLEINILQLREQKINVKKKNIIRNQKIKKSKKIKKTINRVKLKKEFKVKKTKALKMFHQIKCYDNDVAQASFSKECEKKVSHILRKYKKIEKINIIAVIAEDDNVLFNKLNKTSMTGIPLRIRNKIQNYLLKGLAKQRVIETSWYFQKTLKDYSKVIFANYYVHSKRKNKGVLIDFFAFQK